VSVGELIASRFLLRSIAGRGGMGTVYRADDTVEGGEVALKLITGRDVIDHLRFQREAEVLDHLRHPNVVRYIDHGQSPDGHTYLAMEWLEGETLGARLERSLPSIDEAVAILRGAAAGLGAAHAEGVVHRDVKPDNLFLADGSRNVKVLDFGIARGLAPGHTLTANGIVVGTPFYMAPEQARARGGLDARCDVYALGAVMYEMLAGRPPFRSEHLMAVLAAILMEVPVDVRHRAKRAVPDAIADLTMALLSKDPNGRPAHGAALGRALEALPTGAQPSRSLSPPALTQREQRVLCLVLAAGQLEATSSAATLQPGATDVMGSVRAAVEAHGGHPELLADGSMVARIEAGSTPTDQAVHAAHCAVAIRNVAPELPLALVAGRGHFLGPVPVGEVIERGSVLLGRAVAGAMTLAQGAFDGASLAPAGPLPIRVDDVMKALLVSRFEVLETTRGAQLGSEITTPTTARTLLGRKTTCVGRKRELRSLEALYEEAVEEPMARAALVTGAAGIGKSRLIAELLERLRAQEEPPLVWLARGDPVAPGSPFGLVAQLIRFACGIREGEPLEARRNALRARVGDALARPLGELARIPFEAGLRHDAPDDPKLRGDGMRDAFLTWLGQVSAEEPLVLVVDDLQWGDKPSLSLLDAALRELAKAPFLIVGSGRPALFERFGEPWTERDAQPFRLSRLRPKAAEKLVRGGLGDADEALIAKLVERADGNPFFLEELVRAIAEGEGEEGLPTTVLGMVESRLSVLEPATRRVLRAASVFGRRFWRGGVVELLGGLSRATPVDEHLSISSRREIVDSVEPSRFVGQPEFVFRHTLTREASHATLTPEDRRLGHQLAGKWLEEAGEENALVLAEHYDRGGDVRSAALWFGAAAEQALEGDDLEAAVIYSQRAMPNLAPESQGSALVTLADAHRWRGEYDEAFARSVEAANALEAGTRLWFRAVGVLFASAGQSRRYAEAERWRQTLMDVEAQPGVASRQVVALCRAATLTLAEGATGRFESTMALAEKLGAAGEPLSRAWIATLRASEALRSGDQGAFVDGTEAAVAAYQEAGDLRDACNQKVRLGNGFVGLGDTDRATTVLREALTAARRMGLRLVEGYALQNLGHALMRAGALEEAREVEERAIGVARALGDSVLEAGCLLYRAEARQATDAAGAVGDAQRAVDLLEGIDGFHAVALAALGRAQLADERPEQALLSAAAAAAEAASTSMEEGEALVQLVYIEALRACSRPDEAREVTTQAVGRLQERAARISDRGWRDAFLHRVPTHARLLDLEASSRAR